PPLPRASITRADTPRSVNVVVMFSPSTGASSAPHLGRAAPAWMNRAARPGGSGGGLALPRDPGQMIQKEERGAKPHGRRYRPRRPRYQLLVGGKQEQQDHRVVARRRGHHERVPHLVVAEDRRRGIGPPAREHDRASRVEQAPGQPEGGPW